MLSEAWGGEVGHPPRARDCVGRAEMPTTDPGLDLSLSAGRLCMFSGRRPTGHCGTDPCFSRPLSTSQLAPALWLLGPRVRIHSKPGPRRHCCPARCCWWRREWTGVRAPASEQHPGCGRVRVRVSGRCGGGCEGTHEWTGVRDPASEQHPGCSHADGASQGRCGGMQDKE